MQDGSNSGQQSPEPGWVFRPNDPSIQSTPEPQPQVAPQQVVSPPTTTPVQPVSPRPLQTSPVANSVQSQQLPAQQIPQPTPKPITKPVVSAEPIPTLDSYTDSQQYSEANDSDYTPHVEWTASEYIASPKTTGWFMLLGISSVILAIAVYFLTSGDIVSSSVIVIIAVILGIFSARQPKVLNYAIDSSGFHIGDKFYPYGTFKSFSVVEEGNGLGYISLLPLRRFMPPLVIHYDPNDEEAIANTLLEYLPFEDHKPDMVDSLLKRFRL